MHPAVARHARAELYETRGACPDEQAAEEPYQRPGEGGRYVGADDGGGGEDAGADLEAEDEGEAVEVGEGRVSGGG